MKWIIVFSILIFSNLLSNLSNAAEQAHGKKRQAINFEDQLVQGEYRKPELMYLLQKKQFNYGRLIKLRENFVPEMRRTAEEIQRGD